MTIVQSAILGVVEGITEFLPISSTFHLILASTFLRLTQSEFVKFFEIFIQSGAILAVIFLYYKEVMRDRVLFVKLMVSFLPTAVVGIGLYKIIKEVFFERIDVTTITFIIVGIIFLIVEYGIQKKWLKIDKNMSELSYKQAILVGLLQS